MASDTLESGKVRIDREDIRLKVTDEGPALHIGETEILLRTFVKVEQPVSEPWNERTVETKVEVDCDPPNGCWFILTPEDGNSPYPWVDIQPEVRYLDTED